MTRSLVTKSAFQVIVYDLGGNEIPEDIIKKVEMAVHKATERERLAISVVRA